MNDTQQPREIRKLNNFTAYIFLALVLGVISGLALGAAAKPFAEIGKIVISLIKTITIPLVFFTILHAIITTEIERKDGLRLLFFSLFNASIALLIGLVLSNFLRPGAGMNFGASQDLTTAINQQALPATVGQKIDFIATLKSYIPSSVLSPFMDNAVIPVVLLALATGLALRSVRTSENLNLAPLQHLVEIGLKATEKILHWIIYLTPLAVFGVVTYAVGEHGFSPLKNLLAYVGVAILGMTLHALTTQQAWIFFYAKIPLRKFWREALVPVTYSIGTNSSLATLPVTLKALKNLGVSPRASSLGACVGTNLNNDGIILYEAMAVLFVAQAHGLDMTISEQIIAAGFCMIAAMGVAGVPEAGFVSLSLVLTSVGMPVEILPLLLTVDWLVARARSASNVLSDMVLSINIDTSIKAVPSNKEFIKPQFPKNVRDSFSSQ